MPRVSRVTPCSLSGLWHSWDMEGGMDVWLYDAVNGRVNWRPVKVGLSVLAYFVLVGAAIYELVKW